MDDGTEEKIRILDTADHRLQTSLQTENEPDPMDAEQTWPTEDELAQAQGETQHVIHTFSCSEKCRTCNCFIHS